jgi:hypothetical protein
MSTEHVLHPSVWTAGQLPDPIDIGELPAFTAAGLETVETTTLGELEMSIYFELGQSQPQAQKAAAGWGGDQVRVYQAPGGQTPVVWFTTWDDRKEATEAQAAAEAALRHLPPGSNSRVERVGRGVLILLHVPTALQPAAVAQFTSFANRLPKSPPVGHSSN